MTGKRAARVSAATAVAGISSVCAHRFGRDAASTAASEGGSANSELLLLLGELGAARSDGALSSEPGEPGRAVAGRASGSSIFAEEL